MRLMGREFPMSVTFKILGEEIGRFYVTTDIYRAYEEGKNICIVFKKPLEDNIHFHGTCFVPGVELEEILK